MSVRDFGPEAAAAPGSPVHIRRARGSDRPALIEMLGRCSMRTRLQRFHGYVRSFPEPYFTDALAGRAEHFALVAQAPGAVVALASCLAVADDAAELGVLVEDSSQRRGIGTRLLSALIEDADRRGLATLSATVLADQGWIPCALRSLGTCQARVSFGVYDVTLRRESGRRAS